MANVNQNTFFLFVNYLYFKYLENLTLTVAKPLAASTIIFSLTSIQIAQAFTIDFKNPAVINIDGSRTINSSVQLNPIILDSDVSSGGGQSIDLDLSDINSGQRYSTTDNNIGELWNPIGIDISVNGNLGLFNSECIPNGGTNSAAAPANEPCDFGNNNGDPDLATGNGSYSGVSFNTTPQGNLLIREENNGNGVPDDASNGDIIIDFTHDNILSQVRLESVTIVDDAEGDVIVTFTDNSTETVSFNSSVANNPVTSVNGSLLNSTEYVAGENALAIIGGFTQEDVANVEIDFVGSGGFGAFAFSEFSGTAVEVPFGFSPSLGLLISGVGLFGVNYFRKKRWLNQ